MLAKNGIPAMLLYIGSRFMHYTIRHASLVANAFPCMCVDARSTQ